MTSRFRNILLTATFIMGLGALIVPTKQVLAETPPPRQESSQDSSDSSAKSTNSALTEVTDTSQMLKSPFVNPFFIPEVFIADRDDINYSLIDTSVTIDAFATNKRHFELLSPIKDQTYVGTKGHDYITASRAKDVTIDARKGDDQVLGSPGDDVIKGGQGNDSIHGMSGNDVIHGGPGRNYIIGGDGKDTFVVKGTDTLADLDVGDVLKNHSKLKYEATKLGGMWDYTATAGLPHKKWMPVHTEKSIAAMMPAANAMETGVAALLKKIRAHTAYGKLLKACQGEGYYYEDTPLWGDRGLFEGVRCLVRTAVTTSVITSAPGQMPEWAVDFNKIAADRDALRATDMKTKVGALLGGYSAVIVDNAGVVKHVFHALAPDTRPVLFKKK